MGKGKFGTIAGIYTIVQGGRRARRINGDEKMAQEIHIA